MATVHLICGFLGAGKTTFAKALAEKSPAVRLSVDELYLRLFADGPTYDLDVPALDRLLSVLNDIWRLGRSDHRNDFGPRAGG